MAAKNKYDSEDTSSEAPNLHNKEYKDIQEEAECDLTVEEFSDLNRAVS